MLKNLLIYILVINSIGYLIMWYDKKCAQNGGWRVKESTLLIISIIGGSIGSLLGMYKFRHKTKHLKFKIGIPLIIFLQVCLIFIIKLKLYTDFIQNIKNFLNYSY